MCRRGRYLRLSLHASAIPLVRPQHRGRGMNARDLPSSRAPCSTSLHLYRPSCGRCQTCGAIRRASPHLPSWPDRRPAHGLPGCVQRRLAKPTSMRWRWNSSSTRRPHRRCCRNTARNFPTFSITSQPLADWPWLGDVARIDWARREACHAADAEAAERRSVASLAGRGVAASLAASAPVAAHADLNVSGVVVMALPTIARRCARRRPLERRVAAGLARRWRCASASARRRRSHVAPRPHRRLDACRRRSRPRTPLTPSSTPVSAFAALIGDDLIVAVNLKEPEEIIRK